MHLMMIITIIDYYSLLLLITIIDYYLLLLLITIEYIIYNYFYYDCRSS